MAAPYRIKYSQKLEQLLGKKVPQEKAHKTAIETSSRKSKEKLFKSPSTKAYEAYKKRVKALGAKEIATPEQYKLIRKRMAKRIARNR